MSYRKKRDERIANVREVMRWLELNQPAPLARLVASGLMPLPDATNALQYCVRHRIVERELPRVSMRGGALLYRLTGRPLPTANASEERDPFAALLTAWGIALVPPSLPARRSVSVRFDGV